MPVSFPLDRIPSIPSQVFIKVQEAFNTQIDRISEQITTASRLANKLPDTATCNDPTVKDCKLALSNVQRSLNNMNRLIQQLNPIITGFNALVAGANAIKAAQLLNPVTAPAIIAAELVVVQNMTIANATAVVGQLNNLPSQIQSALEPVQKTISDIALNVGSKCNEQITIDKSAYDNLNDETNGNGIDVSLLDSIVKQQKDLLISIEEAASKVYRGDGIPNISIGKPGDYYIDEENTKIYGPKPSRDSWGDGVNY